MGKTKHIIDDIIEGLSSGYSAKSLSVPFNPHYPEIGATINPPLYKLGNWTVVNLLTVAEFY